MIYLLIPVVIFLFQIEPADIQSLSFLFVSISRHHIAPHCLLLLSFCMILKDCLHQGEISLLENLCEENKKTPDSYKLVAKTHRLACGMKATRKLNSIHLYECIFLFLRQVLAGDLVKQFAFLCPGHLSLCI